VANITKRQLADQLRALGSWPSRLIITIKPAPRMRGEAAGSCSAYIVTTRRVGQSTLTQRVTDAVPEEGGLSDLVRLLWENLSGADGDVPKSMLDFAKARVSSRLGAVFMCEGGVLQPATT
jgi:hypothetical protein